MNCNYIKITTIDGEDLRDRCINRQSLREIEFKHSTDRDKSISYFLCESHFSDVFGEVDDEEKRALRDWQNSKYRYNRDYAQAKKQMEYFEEHQFKEHNYPRVQNLFEKWNRIRKKVCRYEFCDNDFRGIKRVFVIRIYSQTGREWANYYLCSQQHWEKFMYRIVEKPKAKQIIKLKKLDDYS